MTSPVKLFALKYLFTSQPLLSHFEILSDAEVENIDGNEEGPGSIAEESERGDLSEELDETDGGRITQDN